MDGIWDNVCLICLQEEDPNEMYKIEEPDENGITLSDKIFKCTGLEIVLNDIWPTEICAVCLSDLRIAFKFCTIFEHSQQKLMLMNTKEESEINELCGTCKNLDEEIIDYVIDEEPTNVIEFDRGKADDEFHNTTEFLEETDPECENSYDVKAQSIISETIINSDTTESDKQVENHKNEKENHIEISTIIETAKASALNRKTTERNKKHMCELCGNYYKKNNLRTHMMRHDAIKRYSCELCAKSFATDVDLYRHMRTHTGGKPYQCKFCDRKYSDYGSRNKHERTHTGEKRYECETCHKKFADSYGVKRHQMVHTGFKQYQCSICGRGFTKKEYLENHTKKHNENLGNFSPINSNDEKDEQMTGIESDNATDNQRKNCIVELLPT